MADVGYQRPGKQRFRLEIHGRDGWFVPATESVLDRDTPDDVARHRLAESMAAYGSLYVADAEAGETYHLMRIPDDGLWHPSFKET